MDFEFRFVPAWQRLAELLAEGYVGNLRFVNITWTVPGRADPSRAWNWYSQQGQGGGALGPLPPTASTTSPGCLAPFSGSVPASAPLFPSGPILLERFGPWMPMTPVV
jgi:hypothetical protein